MAVPCLEYRRSLKVDWQKSFPMPSPPSGGVPRGTIGNLSAKSSRRLIFALLNAQCDFSVMATLTFRERVVDGRATLKRFQRLLRERGVSTDETAWVREYQGRGAVHYHFLFGRAEPERKGWLREVWLEKVQRKSAVRSLVRGPMEDKIVSAWIEAVGDTDPAFLRFQAGGIVELMADGDSAARYFGSYLGKEDQKQMPEGAERCGRWWFMAPGIKPKPIGRRFITDWPFPLPYATVFDKTKCPGRQSAAPGHQPLPTRPNTNHAIQHTEETNQSGTQAAKAAKTLRPYPCSEERGYQRQFPAFRAEGRRPWLPA